MAEGIESLAGCVFVQEVEAPALAVLIPVMVRTCSRMEFGSHQCRNKNFNCKWHSLICAVAYRSLHKSRASGCKLLPKFMLPLLCALRTVFWKVSVRLRSSNRGVPFANRN